ncbi:MAG TPA: ROK family protein, partial [Polyangiaceae bacterium]|nr:ROK family protein [Polyangiaceae bacterium]
MKGAAQHLVFDVGGTQLRAALWDADRNDLSPVHAVDAPSHARHPRLSWAELRARLIAEMSLLRERLDPGGQVHSVAVAFPGPVDPDRRILAAPTLWGALGQYPYELNRELAGRWPGTRVHVLNDVSAAGYRYSNEAEDSFCIVTVSTGIGNKVFAGGRPLVGPSGRGGEIGHLQVESGPGAALCDCGGRGHLGAYASGRGLVARAREDGGRGPTEFQRSFLATCLKLEPDAVTAEALAQAYAAGDEWATRQVERASDALGGVLAALCMGVGIERLVLIGGLAVGLGPRFAKAVGGAVEGRCGLGAGSAI